ncbi:hypothetical protein SDC9_204586 [bioreactor metagenome]|uniref:Uncharacterized protein n=1 Tax=bioreactor metagenome TaxID=1076179 RepID=A0A645JBI1_9ZZZZ
MVAMQVGQEHDIDLCGIVACGLEVVGNEAERGAKGLGGACVDQHQLGAGIDQVGIDCRLDGRAGGEVLGQQALDVTLAGVAQQLGVEIQVAVIERGDLEVPDHHAVKARCLSLDLGGFGKRGGRCQ